MKIAVMGAGAVGCYYGGMLARAGHAVTLIGRPQHVEAVRREGLFLEAQSFKEHVPWETLASRAPPTRRSPITPQTTEAEMGEGALETVPADVVRSCTAGSRGA